MFGLTRSRIACLASLLVLAGCPKDEAATGDDDGTTTGGDTTGGTFLPGESTGATDAADSTGEEESSGEDGAMGECSIWEQDCPEGDKCVPWSNEPDLVPDDIRCCPDNPGGGLHGEPCAVEDYFGSCIDDCALGHMCLDIDNDGSGICQKFCQGQASNPECDADETCLIYFAGVPFCFEQCDPLVQSCPAGEGCYPDEEAAGGTGFICLPTIGGGKVGDLCWLLSSCEPGLLCVTGDFQPDCPFTGCCSSLCDTTADPDPCEEIVPGTECVSWYYAGQMPPMVELENVGACVLPPN